MTWLDCALTCASCYFQAGPAPRQPADVQTSAAQPQGPYLSQSVINTVLGAKAAQDKSVGAALDAAVNNYVAQQRAIGHSIDLAVDNFVGTKNGAANYACMPPCAGFPPNANALATILATGRPASMGPASGLVGKRAPARSTRELQVSGTMPDTGILIAGGVVVLGALLYFRSKR